MFAVSSRGWWDRLVNLYFRLLLLQLRVRLRPTAVDRRRPDRRRPGRRRPGRRRSLWDEVRTPFRVTLTDLDPLRHVNNGKYLSMLDLGRLDLMLRSGFWAVLSERGWYPVVSAQTITYKRSLTLGQRFTLVTRVLGMDDRAAYLEQTFVRRGDVIARAVVQARFLRKANATVKAGGTVPTAELVDAAGAPPHDLTLPEWVQDWAGAVRISSGPR